MEDGSDRCKALKTAAEERFSLELGFREIHGSKRRMKDTFSLKSRFGTVQAGIELAAVDLDTLVKRGFVKRDHVCTKVEI